MDSRLVFAVLFVTLSLMSAGTNGQTTVAPTTSASTPTSTIATVTPTSSASTPTSTIATVTPTSSATAPTSTIATAAPPLTPNTTVETLSTALSRAGCGITKLCPTEPAGCDPSTSSCFFLSANQTSGNNFAFELSGESDGFIALTLSPDATLGGNDTTYVCAKNGSVVQFFGALFDSNVLTVTTVNANSVKGKVTGKTIQCTFNATVAAPTTKATQTTIAVSTGAFNNVTGVLGKLVPKIQGFVSDLADPKTNFTNLLAANTTATTSHGITFQQSLTQAVLMTVGVLSLATF